MKKRRIAQLGLFSLGPFAALFFCAAAICAMILTGTLLAFFHSEAPSRNLQRTLTIAERVAYQRAIEEPFWRHHVWPEKPPDKRGPD
jgi:hypothetical protein